MAKRKYKIVITEDVIEEAYTRREWCRGVEPTTEDSPEGYGYPEQVAEKKVVTKDILIQEVEDLDLPAVIRAINKL